MGAVKKRKSLVARATLLDVPLCRWTTALWRAKGRGVRAICILSMALITVLGLQSCSERGKHRPFGTLRLGAIASFAEPEHLFSEIGILLRRDERGFSAMSTHCTYDLSALHPIVEGGRTIYVSDFSTSRYSAEGDVLSGPAVAPLPYYELEAKAWNSGGPTDTLYVKVGIERPRSWRLSIVK